VVDINPVTKRSSIVYLALLLYAAALFVRISVINWGGVMSDENPAAAAKVLTGSLTPEQQFYPPLLNYLTAIAYAVYYGFGRLVGWWATTLDFRAAYFEDKAPFYLISRFVVAALSATAIPITFILAIDQSIRTRVALVVSAVLIVAPASIFSVQIAKSDNALGPAFLLVLLTALRLCQDPNRVSRQAALGASCAVAISFKQSAIFFLIPAVFISFAATVLSQKQTVPILRTWLLAFLVSALVWIPLNFGTLLNIRGFLTAQAVQSQMSLRSSSFTDSATAWFDAVNSIDTGSPLPVLLAWIFFPVFCFLPSFTRRQKFCFFLIWASVVIGMAVIFVLAGDRQTHQLFLPYSIVIASGLLIGAGRLFDSGQSKTRIIGALMVVSLFFLFAIRSAQIARQAWAEPVAHDVAAALKPFVDPGTRILSDIDLSHYLPVSSQGAREARARDELLAKKYSVILPPIAAESLRSVEGGYVVRYFPFVIGGLENVTDQDAKIILPFAWPLQPYEWQLEYWLSRQYQTFVFRESMLDHSIAAYRNFFSSINKKCTRLAKIPTRKPVVLEDTMLIYRCS
jgi:hypothetical protein